MCGIAVVKGGSLEQCKIMTEAIKHRGYSIEYFSHKDFHVGFVHLPIQELKNPRGSYQHGIYIVWLNGYISNYRELAEKYNFYLESDSDTEFLAQYFDKTDYILRKELSELNGFFSIVVYDVISKEFVIQSDRYGIKQMYYTRNACGTEFYCSEVKGLLKLGYENPLDPDAVDDWHHSLGTLTRDTIYKRIVRWEKIHPVKNYTNYKTLNELTFEEAQEKVAQLWAQSVRRNKITHLKTGVMLSGGVDSGMIAQDFRPDYSFSMDYQEGELSEYDGFKQNSQGIHYTMICSKELAKKYSRVARRYLDDLKAGSCYTNFALTELASKFCRVLYSGAGGDELFMGYSHRYDKPINDVIRRTPGHYRMHNMTHRDYDFAYLRGILTVEDRCSGAYAMETRYPFLDNDLVDYAMRLPEEWVREKKILKSISGLPDSITTAKKRGWSNPYYTNREWTDFMMADKK